MCLGLTTCGEGELVNGVHILVARVVQVYHRLQVLEEEEKGRKVEQEIEKGESRRRERTDDHAHGDGVKAQTLSLSHGACCETRLTERMRTMLMWMSVEVVSDVRIVRCHAIMNDVIDVRVMECHAIMNDVIDVRVMSVTQAWMLSLAFALRFVTKP